MPFALPNVAILLAQMDPITGNSGWIGAGLLGAVLSWLMLVHLPAKDKQIREIMASHNESTRLLAADFKISLDAVVKHCADENDKAYRMLELLRDKP